MKKIIFFCLIINTQISLNATFSIVAIDSETGEIGAAGASCIDSPSCNGCGGVVIINDIIPGVGACNAQASVCLPNVNLQVVMGELSNGATPYDAWLEVFFNDACQFGDFNDRQYGMVGYDNGVVAAHGFTGDNNMAYAGNLTGDYYSIQGNILLGPEILEGIETAFLNATGSLADRLMAALQGANVAGADARCLEEGTSSQSAFLRVAQPNDTMGDFYLDLNVPETPFGSEPIDALQSLYNAWLCAQEEPIVSESVVAICENETYELNGTVYEIGSTSEIFYTAINGCDSTLSLTIEALPTYDTAYTVFTLFDEPYEFEGMVLEVESVTDFTLTANNGCDSIVTIEAQSSGFDGIEGVEGSWNVYPNPTSDYLNVVLDETKLFTYEIIDINGEVCIEGNNRSSNKIDMTKMSVGVYFVKLYVDQDVVIEKIIKK